MTPLGDINVVVWVELSVSVIVRVTVLFWPGVTVPCDEVIVFIPALPGGAFHSPSALRYVEVHPPEAGTVPEVVDVKLLIRPVNCTWVRDWANWEVPVYFLIRCLMEFHL